MDNGSDLIVVFITVPDVDEGNRIGKTLVGEHLAACANLIPGLTSHYWWEGELECSEEVLLIIKTSAELFEKLRERVLELHPYDVPEIVAVPIVMGDPAYLRWVLDSLSMSR